MNADGSGQARLTNSADADRLPDWQPILPLTLNLAAKARQPVNKLRAKATCSKACTLVLSAKGKAGRKFKSKPATFSLPAGVETSVAAKLKKPVLKKVRGKKGKATLSAFASDVDGQGAIGKGKVKLK